MIIVFMRHYDGRDILGCEAEPAKPGDGGGKTKAAIKQQARVLRLHYERISLAAAAERRKPHSGFAHA
jgi:hypothetical protein